MPINLFLEESQLHTESSTSYIFYYKMLPFPTQSSAKAFMIREEAKPWSLPQPNRLQS
jgi:hypothetical protein